MSDKTIIQILSHQAEFIQSDSLHTGLIGGFGSGKSTAGVIKTSIKKLKYPGINVAYYLPTYGLIEDIAFPKFAETLEQMGVRYEINISKHYIDTAFGKIIMRSMSNPERIVGYEVGYSCVDETDLLPKDDMTKVFAMIIGRNRIKLPNGDLNQTDVVGTPEGFKWAYDYFVKNTKPSRSIIKAKTSDNPFLPDSYIDILSETYTPQQLEAYLNGEFVNLTSGNVYNRFDRERNRSYKTATSNDILHVGMDFNITKMNAVIHVKDGIKKHAVAEIVNAYDTADVILRLKAMFPKNRIVIYPDASGENRKSSGKSDIDLLKAAKFIIRKPSKNPFVKDRVNAVNNAFLNAKGESTYFVNTDNCPSYTEALERQTYKNGEPDKSAGFDHITEAGGYFIHYDGKPSEFRTIVRVG